MILETLLSSHRDLPGGFLDAARREILADSAAQISQILASIPAAAEIGEFIPSNGGFDASSTAREVAAATASMPDTSLARAQSSILWRRADRAGRRKTLRRPRELMAFMDIEALEAFDELRLMQAQAALRSWIDSPLSEDSCLAALAWSGLASFTKEIERLRALPVPGMPIVTAAIEDRFAVAMRDLLSSRYPFMTIERLLRIAGLSLLATALVGGPAAVIPMVAAHCSSHGRARFFKEIELRASSSPDEIRLARNALLRMCLMERKFPRHNPGRVEVEVHGDAKSRQTMLDRILDSSILVTTNPRSNGLRSLLEPGPVADGQAGALGLEELGSDLVRLTWMTDHGDRAIDRWKALSERFPACAFLFSWRGDSGWLVAHAENGLVGKWTSSSWGKTFELREESPLPRIGPWPFTRTVDGIAQAFAAETPEEAP